METLGVYVLVFFLGGSADYAQAFSSEFETQQACITAGDELMYKTTVRVFPMSYFCLEKRTGKIQVEGTAHTKFLSSRIYIEHEYFNQNLQKSR